MHRCSIHNCDLTCEPADCPCNQFPSTPKTSPIQFTFQYTIMSIASALRSSRANRCAPNWIKNKKTKKISTTTTLAIKKGMKERKNPLNRTQWNCKHVRCMCTYNVYRGANVGKKSTRFSNHIIIIHIEHITLCRCLYVIQKRTMWQNVSRCTGCDDDWPRYNRKKKKNHSKIPDSIRNIVSFNSLFGHRKWID